MIIHISGSFLLVSSLSSSRSKSPLSNIVSVSSLLDRLYAYVRIDYYLQPERVVERGLGPGHGDMQDEAAEPPVLDLPDWVPPLVRQALYAQRAMAREEERRRTEQQKAKAFADCENETHDLWNRLAVSLTNKQRVCSLGYFQDFVASLRSVVHDSQGLHTSGAGRKCQ
ncbi:hypothetical protein BC939DRAFT_438473 [Gamsiella multidivaricata]|uniref:uncharacterized protein n=1 Tax=Gamsiella multidivaricata TaxID=101098 RepID=UPI00221F09D9|nr:uncharacterized protein BC939DRAFT_438473 [Gamsiella multidivaricata]KAI7830601.1 hypothetical protein BC939DRAFT_438473 [Gamsiella multidivaricata]